MYSFTGVMWSWRDSNPRPNKQQINFLHAYFVIIFRHKAENKHPTLCLSSKFFRPLVEAPKGLFPHFLCPRIGRRRTELPWDILFPYYTSGKTL